MIWGVPLRLRKPPWLKLGDLPRWTTRGSPKSWRKILSLKPPDFSWLSWVSTVSTADFPQSIVSCQVNEGSIYTQLWTSEWRFKRVNSPEILKDTPPLLIGGLEHDLYDFPYIGSVIIPTDKLIRTRIFQRGRNYHQPVCVLIITCLSASLDPSPHDDIVDQVIGPFRNCRCSWCSPGFSGGFFHRTSRGQPEFQSPTPSLMVISCFYSIQLVS